MPLPTALISLITPLLCLVIRPLSVMTSAMTDMTGVMSVILRVMWLTIGVLWLSKNELWLSKNEISVPIEAMSVPDGDARNPTIAPGWGVRVRPAFDDAATHATLPAVAILGLALALGIFFLPPVATVALWLWVQRLHRRAGLPRFARWTAYVLVGLAALLHLGAFVALSRSALAARAPGLSAAQKQSLLANGIAEAMYNGAFAALFVVTGALWVAFVVWRASRRP